MGEEVDTAPLVELVAEPMNASIDRSFDVRGEDLVPSIAWSSSGVPMGPFMSKIVVMLC